MKGNLRVAGDKSISHRAIILGSIADGVTRISGFLEAEDAMATLAAFRSMGVEIEGPESGRVIVHGVGLDGLQAPDVPLDLGNSGTSMRLLCGLLAGQAFDSILTGDSSLLRRPMRRVTDPLASMGGQIGVSNEGTAPLHIAGNSKLSAIDYIMPVASAQVKSCIILAALYAKGVTHITEPGPSRDHSERMLAGFSCPLSIIDSKISISGGNRLIGTEIDVPADISSAAFFLVAATITPGSDIILRHVGVNSTRTGIIEILKLMGADISLTNQQVVGGESIADIRIKSSPLRGIKIPEYMVPLAIDEFPVLFVAAACAEGQTILSGASELRVKESDRIQAMADGLTALGIDAQPTADGMIINGGRIIGGQVDSFGDHRIAMAFSIAGFRASDEITILNCANVRTSFPDFVSSARDLGLDINECWE